MSNCWFPAPSRSVVCSDGRQQVTFTQSWLAKCGLGAVAPFVVKQLLPFPVQLAEALTQANQRFHDVISSRIHLFDSNGCSSAPVAQEVAQFLSGSTVPSLLLSDFVLTS